MIRSHLFLSLLLLISLAGYSKNIAVNKILDPCSKTSNWRFITGKEFPGARGGLTRNAAGKIILNYDFTKGGKYVAIIFRNLISKDVNNVKILLESTNDCKINYRMIDATGRCFQGKSQKIKAKTNTELALSACGPWSGAWSGKKSQNPEMPVRLLLLVCKQKELPATGSVELKLLSGSTNSISPHQVTGSDISEMDVCGWKLKGQWLEGTANIYLFLNAKSTRAVQPLKLSITAPLMSRNFIKNYMLLPTIKQNTMSCEIPFKNGGNKRNIYRIKISLSGKNFSSSQIVELKGSKSSGINLGTPIASSNIKHSIFGTVTHFTGQKGSWRQYKKLIDMIAACGFKWIRDSCRIIKGPSGKWQIDPHNLEWIKYAKSKSLNIILLIHLFPRYTISEHLAVAEAAVRDARKYVNVFELGNEPNNYFWRKKFGGSWNGRAENNSASPWVVEHLKYTNAIADHLKKIFPDITLIGLGACPPTNFRYFDLGLTKSLDGIVDHPYSYSLPPEKVPYGWQYEKRDGVKVGDSENTFSGLIKSYQKKIRKAGYHTSIWLTEFGYSTFWFNGKNEKMLYAGFSENAQAVYIVRRFLECMTLPVKAICQYDFIDDFGSHEFQPEANFGLIRSNYNPKPSYYAVQRMTSLLNGWMYDSQISVSISAMPLHRSCIRTELVKNWDNSNINAANQIKVFALSKPDKNNEKILVAWSTQPYSKEFNNRICRLKISGIPNYNESPIGINIITGETFDIPITQDKDKNIQLFLSLSDAPIVIKLFKHTE